MVGDPADMVRLGTFSLSGAFVAWMSGALKDKQGTMMATLRSIGDAVIATDRHGCVRFLNPSAETLTGWTQKDAKGRPLGGCISKRPLRHRQQGPITGAGGVAGCHALPENIHLISKSGGRVPIDDSLAPVQIESGRILGSILVFRDATRRRQERGRPARRRSDNACRHSEWRRSGGLAGGVAHDFNNLLMIINGYADLVLKQVDRAGQGRYDVEANTEGWRSRPPA